MGSTSDPGEDILRSRVEDTVRLCDKRNTPCFLGFLDLREQALVRRCLSHLPAERWAFAGGHEEAERRLLIVCPDYLEPVEADLPLCVMAFHYRPVKHLTHRDVLGTLLAAGIRRDKIGDILCGEGLSVVFLRQEIAAFVCENIDRIGGEGVTCKTEYTGELPVFHSFEDIRETVASPRLDVLVKALLHCSRDAAAQMIRLGSVSVDHLPTDSVSLQVSAPCTLSIRGSGRFLIDQIGPETKKGRLQLVARKCK